LYNVSDSKCTSCPDQYNFNSSTNTCNKVNNDFLTAKNASKLVNAGMPTAYWNYVSEDIKSKNSSVK
jgi:hypothetical protein